MSRTLVATAIAAFALAQGGASAQVARIEYHPFTSVTLSDAELLTGQAGRAVTLAGELRLPRPGTEKLPAVIFLHGVSGVGGTGWMPDVWAPELNQLGIATFSLDSLSGRGVTTAAQLGSLFMVVDAYRALELLAKHPRIDRDRIALMGFSRGGTGTLYASMKRFQKTYGPAGDLQFAAYIPFYPNCVITYRESDEVSDRPIRIHHGTDDDNTPIALCKAYMERLAKAGRDARLIEYVGAKHVFDAPFFRKPVLRPTTRYVRRCRLGEGEPGQIINLETEKPFRMNDSCVEQGGALVYDERASAQARSSVREFLTKTLAAK